MAEGKKKKKEKKTYNQNKFYSVEGDKLKRVNQTCPKCGPSTFMAEHKNRRTCGKCGFAEFKKE